MSIMTLGEIQTNPPRCRQPSDSLPQLTHTLTPAGHASVAATGGGQRSVSQLLLTLQIII